MPYEYLVILHIIGTAIGAGGATYSDFLFYKIIKDAKIDSDEYDLLRTSSFLVWFGFILLLLTGLGFVTHSDFTGLTDKLLAKLVIVTIILMNAFLMHLKIFPLIKHHVRWHKKLTRQPFARDIGFTLFTGTVSIISWYSALVIGGWRGLAVSVFEILTIYFVVLFIGILISQFIGRKFMKSL